MNRIEKLLEFLNSSGKDSFLQHALALEYIKTGEDAKARALFEEILEREPGYIGSYYHLGKLLQRIAEPDRATYVFKRGMEEAEKAGDRHSYSELHGALEELED
jgi:Tfp pilus assembly protein PilF